MAMCAVCNRSITAKQIKITWCDCEKDFHGIKLVLELYGDAIHVMRILKDRNQVLEDKLDEMTIKDDVVMQAVKDVGSALGFRIQDTMIDACHTLGKKPNSKDPPGIIAKFVKRMDADTLLAKRRVKKDLSTRHLNLPTDSPVYLNESLTPMRRKLLAMARDEK
ncbi:hypothetical protein J6590_044540 [Homalodisca vitripennis]|nr:hypothetical protein J6590_044540 [Homalodisca vitripennis]